MNKRLLAVALAAACASSEPKETRTGAAAKPPPIAEYEPAPSAVADELRRREDRPATPLPAVNFWARPPNTESGRSAEKMTFDKRAPGAVGVAHGTAASLEGAGEWREPRSAGVRAGSSDDNLQFKAFLEFLAKNGRRALPHDASRRAVVEVRDARGLPVFGANLTATDAEGHVFARRRTYPDGRALVFPPKGSGTLRVEYGGVSQAVPLSEAIKVQLDVQRSEASGRVPLDVAFVIDTTGSMGDEIERLKKTLDVIHFQLAHLDPGADVRFGLVEYKDRGDEFVTRPIPFTADLEKFRASLANLRAGGGGDEPEDVQAGLEQALHGLQWRGENAVKVAFLIGDAAPHLDYGEQFTYQSAMQEAARRGIKIAAVGCSGLSLTGEVVWREIAQYTLAPYVFLTRGERGDMDGSPSTVSHHVGSNFATENLETIVVRVVKNELAPLASRTVAAR